MIEFIKFIKFVKLKVHIVLKLKISIVRDPEGVKSLSTVFQKLESL